jgi:hypothetical protein
MITGDRPHGAVVRQRWRWRWQHDARVARVARDGILFDNRARSDGDVIER